MPGNDIDIKLKLDGEKDFKNAVRDANTELKNMQSALKLADAQAKASGNSTESLAKKEEALSKVLDSAKNKRETLTKVVEKARAKQEEAAKTLEEARKAENANAEEIAKAERAYQSATNRVNDWERQLNNAEKEVVELDKELNDSQKELGETADESEKLTNQVAQFAKMEAATKVFDKLGAAAKKLGDQLADSVEKADAFEVAVAKISTIADASVDLGAMADELQKLSREMGVSVEDLSESTYQAISASVDTADAVKFVEKATKLSIGGFTDSTTAVDTLTTVINAYGLSVEEVDDISNTLIKTQKLGKTSVGELGSSLGQVVPAAAAYGTKLKDLSSAYVLMTRGGINTANATTMLKSMLNELGKEGSKVSTIIKDKTGKSFSDLMAEGKNLGDVIDVLSQSVDGDTTAFANLWSNQRAGMGALALLNAGTEEYRAVLDDLTNSTGAADEAYQKMADTSEMTGKRLEESINGFKTAVGSAMAPTIDETKERLADMINKATDGFENLPDSVQETIGAIALVGTKALEAAPQVMSLVTQIATLKMAKSVTGDAATATGKFTTALKGAGVAIGAASAAIAVAVALYKNYRKKIDEATEGQRKFAAELEGVEESYAGTHEAVQILVEGNNEYIDSASRAMQLESMRVQVRDDQIKADQNLKSAQVQLKNKTDELAEAQRKYDEAMRYTGQSTQVTRKDLTILQEQQEALTAAVESANTVYEQTTSDLAAINGALEEAKAQEESTAATVEDSRARMIKSYDASITKEGEELAAFQQLSLYGQEMATRVSEAILTMHDSITGSISSLNNWFDKVEEREAQNADTMAQNLAAQIADIKNWEENLAYLADKGINKELLQYLADMGPSGAAYVQALVDSANGKTKVGLEDMNRLWEEKLNLEKGINDEAEAVYKGIGELEAGSKLAFDTLAEQMNASAKETGEGVALGMAEGIRDAQAEAEKAAQELGSETTDAAAEGAETASPSRATMRTGKFVAEGLRNGINQGIAGAKSAAQNLGKQVVNTINSVATGGTAKAAGLALGNQVSAGIVASQMSVSASARTLGITAGQSLASGVYSQQGASYNAGASLTANAVNGMRAYVYESRTIGLQMAEGLTNGIYAGQSMVIRASANMAQNALQAAKNILKINSPSKAFEEEVGKQSALGVVKGFNQTLDLNVGRMVSTVGGSFPDFSRYNTGANVAVETRVYIGDKELSSILSAAVVKDIATRSRAYNASGGR